MMLDWLRRYLCSQHSSTRGGNQLSQSTENTRTVYAMQRLMWRNGKSCHRKLQNTHLSYSRLNKVIMADPIQGNEYWSIVLPRDRLEASNWWSFLIGEVFETFPLLDIVLEERAIPAFSLQLPPLPWSPAWCGEPAAQLLLVQGDWSSGAKHLPVPSKFSQTKDPHRVVDTVGIYPPHDTSELVLVALPWEGRKQ